jgi:hypothetical protein
MFQRHHQLLLEVYPEKGCDLPYPYEDQNAGVG